MALREFSDANGRRWRAWEASVAELRWLAFESADGEAKCRLEPVPDGWQHASHAELLALLHRATPVRGDRESPAYLATAIDTVANGIATVRRAMRSFRFPGGRYWSVGEWIASEGQAPRQPVLRFASGSRVLELTGWPADWRDFSEEQLARLLACSFPRDPEHATAHAEGRRASDRASR